MTQDEIIKMAKTLSDGWWLDDEKLERFAKLVAQHERKTLDEEAKAHLEELRKNFNTESAELRLHMWSKEKQA